MINRKARLSLFRQCKVLRIAHSSIYYQTKPIKPEDIALMQQIDEIHLNRPFLGVFRMTDALQGLGHTVNHKHVYCLMCKMTIQALYPKPNLSQAHEVHSYLALAS